MDVPVLLMLMLMLTIAPLRADRSLLCTQCKCIENADGTTDVDCTDVFITYAMLYDKSTWTGTAFGRVVLSKADLPDLLDPFPPSNLTHLDLSKNFIRKINDSCFAQFQNMNTLILSDNEIDLLRPDVFKGLRTDGYDYPLRSLKTLRLDNNRLHTLNDDLFRHLEQVLEVLDLSYNPFRVLDQQTTIAIGSIIYLKELYLSYTNIKKLPEHFLHTPKHLKVLDLSGNGFVSVPEGLTDVHTLETLIFNANPIVNLTEVNGFGNISTLRTLYFCNMLELECIGPSSISKLEHLTELHICNNIKLWHIDKAALSRLEEETRVWLSLTNLSLHNNQLTTIDVNLLLNWDHLEDLDLSYNPWTCDCENQWIVDMLVPLYVRINPERAKQMRCAAPAEMAGLTLYNEYNESKHMRCSDLYGNRPERDGPILIGILLGLLMGIPLVLFLIFAYQRNWFGICDKGPAAYSRQFYRRTRSDEL